MEWYSVDNAGNTESARSATFTVVRRFDDAALTYSPQWFVQSDQNMFGGYYHHTTAAGASVEATITGSRIWWYGPKASSYGTARVYLDGALVAEVDQYSPTYLSKQLVFDSGVLADGPHGLRIEATGIPAPGFERRTHRRRRSRRGRV